MEVKEAIVRKCVLCKKNPTTNTQGVCPECARAEVIPALWGKGYWAKKSAEFMENWAEGDDR